MDRGRGVHVPLFPVLFSRPTGLPGTVVFGVVRVNFKPIDIMKGMMYMMGISMMGVCDDVNLNFVSISSPYKQKIAR